MFFAALCVSVKLGVNKVFWLHSTTLQTDDGDILIDYSKNLINQDVLAMLLALVRTHSVFYFERQLELTCSSRFS